MGTTLILPRQERKPATAKALTTRLPEADRVGQEIVAFFEGIEHHVPAPDTGEVSFDEKLGPTTECITANDLDHLVGPKGQMLKKRMPKHLRQCPACREAFDLFRVIRSTPLL